MALLKLNLIFYARMSAFFIKVLDHESDVPSAELSNVMFNYKWMTVRTVGRMEFVLVVFVSMSF